MNEKKKPKRPYDSTRRREQARRTRRQITEAARKLFTERGYTGATIEAIAQEAGVATETVYSVFGNKRAILAHLIDVSVGGDDSPIPLLQRKGPQSVFQESDPQIKLVQFAEDIALILERVAPLFEVMRMAAKTEPEIAELLEGILEERLSNMTTFVQHLTEHHPLLEELSEAQAAELVWTLTSPEVFQLLTIDRAHSTEEYSQWLAGTLSRLLLL